MESIKYTEAKRRAQAIIEGKEYHADGYTNMLNKYGTAQDNSTAYTWQGEAFADDMQLVSLYEGNGLFNKIIDRPAEEAVKHGLDIDFGSDEIAEYVEDKFDNLEFEESFATAIKWARLYGGAIIVMLVNDGRTLEQPLDWNAVRSIEELRVFERSVCEPDYTSLNNWHFQDSLKSGVKFGEPEYYNVFSMYGNFRVHASRCLVFRNGKVPEHTSNAHYRYWGIPEYVKIKKALRECITSHEYGVKMLERSVQAIYKMKNLANLLVSEDGEDKVIQRLQVIDMARGILNSIAIDNDGEDYDFKNMSLAGTKDIMDSTCNMLSAVTNIPQTVLFGRSPAGENSTGQSDLENYYNMVENIQKQNMKKNVRTLVDLILIQGVKQGWIDEKPKYKVKFAPLWSLNDVEQAQLQATRAGIEQTKAATAQVYIDTGVLDASEVRKSLAKEGDFDIEEVLDEEDFKLPEDTFDMEGIPTKIENSITEAIQEVETPKETDSEKNITTSLHESFGKAIAEVEDMDTTEIAAIDIEHSLSNAIEDVQNYQEEESHIPTLNVLKKASQDAEIVNIADHIAEVAKMVINQDGEDLNKGVGVLVIKDGMILVAQRTDGDGICGPGGHMHDDETPQDAAIRETKEEFGIEPLKLIPLGQTNSSSERYCNSKIFLCDQYNGNPKADGAEMTNATWMTMEEIQKQKMFPPFEASLTCLAECLKSVQ